MKWNFRLLFYSIILKSMILWFVIFEFGLRASAYEFFLELQSWPIHSRPQSLRSLWPATGIESSGSNRFEITKEITEFCPSGLTRSSSTAHARNGCSQSSRFLPQARRIVGSGDENGRCPVAFHVATKTWVLHVFVLILLACFCAIFVPNQGKVA